MTGRDTTYIHVGGPKTEPTIVVEVDPACDADALRKAVNFLLKLLNEAQQREVESAPPCA